MGEARETWSSREAAKITRIPHRSLCRWAHQIEPLKSGINRRRVVGPGGKPTLRWTFTDLLVARLFRDLRAQGISMQRLRPAADYVAKEGLDVRRMVRVGKDLMLWLGPASGLSVSSSPGQVVSRYLVWDTDAVGQAIQEGIEKLKLAA